MKKLEERPWWPELVELKDVLSLRELSERFGAAPAAISNALKRNNLRRKAAPPGPRNKRSTNSKRKAAERLASMGLAPLPTDAASQIVPAEASPKATRGRSSGGSRLEPYLDLIGKVIDRDIAAKAGVSVSAVTNYRRRHDIPAATRRPPSAEAQQAAAAPAVSVAPRVAPAEAPKARPAAAPKAAPKAMTASSGVQIGFRVTINEVQYVVVAADIVEAARVASSSGQGEVTRLELLGQAIGA